MGHMIEMLTKQRELMKEYRFDAMVTMSTENIAYLIGTPVPSQLTIRSRHVIVIVPMDQDPVVICVNIEEELIKNNSWMPADRVYSYNEFLTDPIVMAAEKMKELGLDGKRVGIEFNYLPAKDYLTLRQVAPNIEFVNGQDLLDEMRKIKFQFELDFIEAFGKRAEDVIFSAFEGVHAGSTEMDIYRILMQGFSEIGGEKPSLIVASGERSSMLNAGPTDRVLKEGDLVRIDLVGTKKGYYCDVCRTAVVGKPSEEQARIWKIVTDSFDNIVRQLKPGVDTHDIYMDYAKKFKESGYQASIDFVAHGVGISCHEEPYINSFKHNILKKDMCMCVEPIYIVPGVGGYQFENEIFITDDGCRIISLNRPYHELPVICV